MKISEFINECNELLLNKQFKSLNFSGQNLPENTQPELEFGQNYIWQQGQSTNVTYEDIVTEVLTWTNWNPHIISIHDLCSACMGYPYEDRELKMSWNK